MTANQIEFAKHRETRRHNYVTERQGWRDVSTRSRQADAAMLSAYASTSQAETAARRAKEESRHNQELERVNWWSTERSQTELERHNAESEKQAWVNLTQLGDLQRKQGESLLRQAQVAERNADVNETDSVSRRISALASRTGASAAYQNALTNHNALAESMRHNLELERLQGFTIRETERSHRQSESLELTRLDQQATRLEQQAAELEVAGRNADAAMLRAQAQMLTAGTEAVYRGINTASSLGESMARIIGGLS